MCPNLLEISTPSRTAVALVAESKERYGEAEGRWVEVLVDCPGAQGVYVYAIPPHLQVQSGDILSVPFGAQQVGAVAIQRLRQPSADVDPAAIRPVEDVISRGFFPPTYWELLQRVADYYCTPFMQVVRVALPPGLLGRSQRRIRLTATVPSETNLLLPPSAQQILTLLQTQKHGDYSWHYLQRQVRGASRGLTDLIQRGWVESYLEPPTLVRPKQRQAVTLTHQPPATPLSLQQQEILNILRRQGGEMWLQDLLQRCQVTSSVVKTLERKGCVVIRSQEVLRLDAVTPVAPDRPKVLTAKQAEALAKIKALTGHTQVLLHGVTGSGKTEIYLQAIAPVLQQGKSALVLVPEIGLTPQLTDRFRARFGAAVHVYHSALSDGERYDTWRQMLDGSPQVLIGTRSAVFAPLPQLGLIILDEEHDSSFKQDQPAPCYHARTVAQWRSELVNCPLILGSATPCLESWVEASQTVAPPFPESQQSTAPSPAALFADPPILHSSSFILHPSLYLSLPHRIHDRPLPPIDVVDMRQELQQGNRSIFSRSLQDALQEMRDRQQQGLLFIHRRGHSTFVSCRSCGHVMECPHCDVSLTYHQTQIGGYETLRCHYCGYGQSHPSRCPVCDAPYLKHFGSGTQRVMQELAKQFPSLRCLRFDSDTTRAKGSHRALLTRFAAGEADVLVGTQMLTKGIDLPQVTLVGVVAADGLLHLADFRASERAFQVLTQVAGRAGRGDDPGRVILQTYSPQHPVIEAVVRQNYPLFAETELQHRQALHYPPYGRLIAFRLSSLDADAVQQTATALAQHLRSRLETELTTHASSTQYELLGPAPAAIVRVSRRYRWQLLLKVYAHTQITLPSLEELRSHCPASVSLTIDVDPLRLL
jgi:primosomal protein N' (replication factor Y)